jgi:hypothetical protein
MSLHPTFGSPRSGRFAPPRSEGRTVALVVTGVLLLGALGILAVGGGFMVYGLGLLEDQVAADLRGNAVLQAHLGEVIRFDVNFSRSMLEPDQETLVFDVTGLKGAGRVTARCVTVDADHEKVTAGTLRMDSGAVYDLFPPAGPAGAGSP